MNATRDRYGEYVDDDQADEHECDRGWLDRDSDPARPCLVCRPHLARKPRAPQPNPLTIQAGVARCRAVLRRRSG